MSVSGTVSNRMETAALPWLKRVWKNKYFISLQEVVMKNRHFILFQDEINVLLYDLSFPLSLWEMDPIWNPVSNIPQKGRITNEEFCS